MLRFLLVSLTLTTIAYATEDTNLAANGRKIRTEICDPNAKLLPDGTKREFACWDHFVPKALQEDVDRYLQPQASTWSLELETWKRLDDNAQNAFRKFIPLMKSCMSPTAKDFSWVKRLKKKFGEPYVAEQTGNIVGILGLLHNKLKRACMGDSGKTVFETVSLRRRYSRNLANLLLGFYSSLSKKEQKKHKETIKRLENLLALLESLPPSLEHATGFFDSRSPAELRAETRALKAPQDLREFLEKDQVFKEPFSIDMLIEFNQLILRELQDQESDPASSS